MKPKNYAEAGVDIEKGDAFARHIAGIQSPAVSRGIGGFAGGIELDMTGVSNPVLLSSTDGVGTKLLVARRLETYDTLGIDLVAMCVNDLAVAGVRPQVFLDYIACGKIQSTVLEELMKGIVTGCEQAGCTLAGGETAEMPDVYRPDDFDLAGFCSGVGDKSRLLPRSGEIQEGDILLAFPSSGVHSNGFSLARKLFEDAGDEIWRQLLTPTRIYVEDFMPFHEKGLVKAAAHITGGGVEGNLQRILPQGATPHLTWDWEVPEIFTRIRNLKQTPEPELRKVFNMGLGLIMVVSPSDLDEARSLAQQRGLELIEAGKIVRG